jgi:hypothetical protein
MRVPALEALGLDYQYHLGYSTSGVEYRCIECWPGVLYGALEQTNAEGASWCCTGFKAQAILILLLSTLFLFCFQFKF